MKKFNISHEIEKLLTYGQMHLGLSADDVIYVRNKLLTALGVDEPESEFAPDTEAISKLKTPSSILNGILDYAQKAKLTNAADRLQFETMLMDCLCPPPSRIIERFDAAACRGIKSACDAFYDFCFKSNYIRYDDVMTNVRWKAECEKATLDITINVSKPEKDNKDVAAARKAVVKNKYPKCVLCKENVGFSGKPYRHTLRTIPLELNGEQWYFQYSPYNYFNEHCIVLSENHTPMNVNDATITRLLDFIEIFPHYFIGSNAALPVIGGSILTHDHYQGGAHMMPMFDTKTRTRFNFPDEPAARITAPDWYNNVIRIESTSRDVISRVAAIIRNGWDNYSVPELEILHRTTEQHNAITPIARFNDKNEYCLDIILRNNRADERRPDGIFHVTPDMQNIKKEAIGLIEAMGVFILPGRLATEAAQIKEYLTGNVKLDLKSLAEDTHPLNRHLGFIVQLVNDHGVKNGEDAAGAIIEKSINQICEKILKCTAVFKEDSKGTAGFLAFMKSLGFVPMEN